MHYNFDQKIDRHHTNSVKWDVMEAVFGSGLPENALPLWVADMDFAVAPPIQKAIQKRAEHPIFGYSFPGKEFFDTCIDWMSRRYGWQTEADWMVFSPGVVPILHMAVLTFTEPGDKVVSLTPVYGPFRAACQGHGREFVSCPLVMDEHLHANIDFEHLESLIDDKTKMLMLCNPHNPTGRSWSEEELCRLVEICCKHDLIIMSDEIHADFVYSGHKHTPVASISPEAAARTISAYAPSKSFNIAGLAASLAVIPNAELRDKFKAVKGSYSYSGNLFAYPALQAAWSQCDDWLDQLLTYLEGNRDYLVNAFSQEIPHIKVGRPEATYLLWLDCRELMAAKGLEDEKALHHYFSHDLGLCLNAGSFFGPEGEGFLRLNYGCPRQVLEEAVSRLTKA